MSIFNKYITKLLAFLSKTGIKSWHLHILALSCVCLDT